jgi:hypothetical protein
MMTATIYRASGVRLLILNYVSFYYFVRGDARISRVEGRLRSTESGAGCPPFVMVNNANHLGHERDVCIVARRTSHTRARSFGFASR